MVADWIDWLEGLFSVLNWSTDIIMIGLMLCMIDMFFRDRREKKERQERVDGPGGSVDCD